MKRIKPTSEPGKPDYPTAKEAGLGRRKFITVVVGTGAVAVIGTGAVALGGYLFSGVRTPGKIAQPEYLVRIHLKPPHVYQGCDSAIEQIVVRCYDKKFLAFLNNERERDHLVAIIRKVLTKHKCADLSADDRNKINVALGKAVGDYYKRRSGSDVDVGDPSCEAVLAPSDSK